jgi:hypothetical protein
LVIEYAAGAAAALSGVKAVKRAPIATAPTFVKRRAAADMAVRLGRRRAALRTKPDLLDIFIEGTEKRTDTSS